MIPQEEMLSVNAITLTGLRMMWWGCEAIIQWEKLIQTNPLVREWTMWWLRNL